MGKTIIEHNLESIYQDVDEVIIVTKYLSEVFPKTLWDSYKWTPITYVIQWDKKWPWAALLWIESEIDTLILNGDSIFTQQDLKNIINHNWYAVLVKEVVDPSKYWVFELTEIWNLKAIIEKPEHPSSNLVNTGVYKMPGEIFEVTKSLTLSPRWEYEITDAINILAEKFPVKPISLTWEFVDIWYAWNIHDANIYFLSALTDSRIDGTIEDGVYISGKIILEAGAIIKSGSYIEWNCYIGKDSVIWPNAYLRWNTCIGDNSKVGFSVECKNTTLWDNTKISHLSYIWDSIVWNNVNLWCGFKTANMRHDKKSICVMNKWSLIDTWKNKFGVIIWDSVSTGINTLVYPGRTIETNWYTLPGEIVK